MLQEVILELDCEYNKKNEAAIFSLFKGQYQFYRVGDKVYLALVIDWFGEKAKLIGALYEQGMHVIDVEIL
jgi:hypothetical protein